MSYLPASFDISIPENRMRVRSWMVRVCGMVAHNDAGVTLGRLRVRFKRRLHWQSIPTTMQTGRKRGQAQGAKGYHPEQPETEDDSGDGI